MFLYNLVFSIWFKDKSDCSFSHILQVNGTSALSLNHIEVVNLIKCKSRHFAFIYKKWFHVDCFQIDETYNLMFPSQQNLFH